ncbi:3-carboxy-cis,cis-muconate cycloisomerase [Streptomyces cinnabarinus]|uniref:3-carboxy-cis,cis-muconate cycloisomerase n=1 Tax=Streptomyces cinnabarinus TaxID=67287 RepID=A0ABY7KBC5_9ACTN|nr:3-carboxy-cis,cis-muconate cycloisomerase [Streptomyces cinnabarinus]WAZ21811.1 3-carboxy-cis,cis-muconate cycloisomerase [Streptomyces cinnabarinus]
MDSALLSPVRAGAPTEGALSDAAWVQAMLDAEAALARAQARLGTVPEGAARTISACARADRFDLAALAERAREAANPVVALVEELTAVVAAEDPRAAEYVHRGSTSQDILDTGAMLVARRTLEPVVADLDRTAAALAGHAERHRGTVMAARTLGQHAVPTVFGLRAAGWLTGVLDARRRIAALLDGGLPVQLGGAAGTLAGYVEYLRLESPAADPGAYAERLTQTFAAELGLAVPVLPWHTLRTPLGDLAAALAGTAGALGKFALDVQTLARTELAEVAEPAVAGRGRSSAMPQKRNPVLATLIRSVSLQVPSLVAVLYQCAVAEDERPAGAWHAEWQPLRETLRLVGGAAHTAAELAEGLVVDAARMRENLAHSGSLPVAERLAAALTPALGRAGAQSAVREAALAPGADLTTALHGLDPRLLEPEGYLGAAPALVDRALRHYRHSY